MDFENLAANLGIDKEDFIELLELFIITTRNDMEKITQSLASGDAPGAASAAHSIKGAAGNLGFMDLSEIAKEMEMAAKDSDLSAFPDRMKQLQAHVAILEKQLDK